MSMHRTAELIGLVAAMLGVIGPTLAVLRAQVPPHGGVLRISRTPRPPLIEDFVAGDPPDSMRPISDSRQCDPGDGVPVSDSTTACFSSGDGNLYVVFVCRGDPRQVRPGLAKRE